MEKVLKHNIRLGDSVSYGIQGSWFPDGTVILLEGSRLVTSKGHKYRLDIMPDVADGVDVLREKFFAVNGSRKWELKNDSFGE